MSDIPQEKREGIWSKYGLKMDPFLTNPLLVKGGIIPMETFTGREDDLKRIKNKFSSIGGSRTLVCGDVGVGKTTFVNYARFDLMSKGFFSPFREIAVLKNWGPNDFVMNTMSAIYSTIKLLSNKMPKIKKTIVSKKTLEDLEILFDLIPKKRSKSVRLSLPIVGGDYQTSYGNAQNMTYMALQEKFTNLINEISSNVGNEIIIHYNNLELIPKESLKSIMDDLRDIFQTPKVHFVLVGNFSVHNTIFSMPRISSIFSDIPIILSPMSKTDINEIIDRRIKFLSIEGLNVIKPCDSTAITVLYNLYSGNIRDILNGLSTAVLETNNISGKEEKAPVLNSIMLSTALVNVVKNRYLSKMTDAHRKVIVEAAKREEFTNTQLSKLTNMKPQNISKYINNLTEMACIKLKRTEGRNVFYTVEHPMKWISLEENEEKKTQRK